MALDAHVHIKADVGVNNTERNRIDRAVLVAENFFCIDVVNALILGCVSAETQTLVELFEGVNDVFPKISVKE